MSLVQELSELYKLAKSIVKALVGTFIVALITLGVALVISSSGSRTIGIDAFAGGLSQRLVNVFLACLVILFVGLLLFFRRAEARG